MRERRFGWDSTLLCAALSLSVTPVAQAQRGNGRTCSTTALLQASACELETKEDGKVELAVCLNLSDPEEREQCEEERTEGILEARDKCRDQHAARLELCEQVGEAPYDPQIDPADFVEGIDNPFAPFAVGAHWVYEKQSEEGLERIEINVLEETREILGVECTVVSDRVFLDGELVEDTLDWVAQDLDGNVWYFGEIAQNFEDELLVNLDGSWEAGLDGAKAGYWVKAQPFEGEVYRQEWFAGEAEDAVEIVNLDAQVDVPFANGSPVLQTLDYTPIDPGVFEFKFYVPGVGLTLEVDPETGEQLELVEFSF